MRSRQLLSVCAVALALIAAACGGDDNSSDLATKDPKAAMAAAVERTTESKTVRLALSATSSTDQKLLEGSGSYDFANKRGRFTLTTTLGPGADLLLTETDVYVKVPAKAKPTDPSWIRLTEADLAKAGSSASSQFINSIRRQMDPRSTLDALGERLEELDEVGESTIRGTKTTHLRGNVDLSDKAIEAAPEEEREGLRAAQKVFGADGYPVDVWLDGDGRVRRVQYAVTSGEGASKATTTVKLDLYDFGKVPAIELPAPSDVGDSSSLTTTTAAGK